MIKIKDIASCLVNDCHVKFGRGFGFSAPLR